MDYNYQNNNGYNNVPQGSGGVLARLKSGPDAPALRKLCLTAFICGIGLLLYPFMGDIFSAVILSKDSIYTLYTESYEFQMFTEILYSCFCVGGPFFLVNILLRLTGAYKKSLPFGKVYDIKNAAVVTVAGLGVCYFGSLVTSYIAIYAESAGFEFYSRNELLEGVNAPDSVLGIILMIAHSALIPALVEEYAFRGVLLQPLRAWGDWFAIIVSAILFGLMHANMTQVPFAVIAGLALGFAGVVTGSLWTGVCIHFLNNLSSVVYSVLLTTPYENYAWIFSSAITYGSIAVGAVAVFIYMKKNPSGFNLRRGQYPALKGRTAAYFLSPTVFVAVVMLALLTLNDIVV